MKWYWYYETIQKPNDQIKVTCGFRCRQESTMWHQALAVLSIFSRHRIPQRIDVTPWAADPSSRSQQVFMFFTLLSVQQENDSLHLRFKGFCPRNFTENNAPTFFGLINFHLFAVPHLSIWILLEGGAELFRLNKRTGVHGNYKINIQASNRTWLLHWHSCHWLEQKIHSESFPASLRCNSCSSKHDAKSEENHAMLMLPMQ